MSRSSLPPPPTLRIRTDTASPTADNGQPSALPPAVRVQMLATEHWSLLATRSMTQSEVLSRITMFLTLVSASIVSLALIGQVTGFDQRFITFALVLLGMVVIVGILTQMRVGNAAIEDLAHVVGMNRLRAAYVELDPAIARYLVTSAHDDDDGLWQTYDHLMRPKQMMGLLASSGTFITFFNAGLIGVFAGLVAGALSAPGPVIGVVAAACGVGFFGTTAALGVRQFRGIKQRYVARFPAL
ncbi:MAG TPA: hypothetical protein VGK54_08545 [Chloroflexota bacterium]